MDCSPPGFFYGILQARILEWVAIHFSRGSSRPRDTTLFSRITDSLPPEPPGKLQTTIQRIKSDTIQLAGAAVKSLQWYPTLCNPIDSSPPGFPIPGILQARILEWVAIPFSKGSSPFRDQTWVSCIAGRSFITEPSGSPLCIQRTFSFWH